MHANLRNLAYRPVASYRPHGMPKLTRAGWLFLVVFFALYNAFALARMSPLNWTLAENTQPLKGDVDFNVQEIFRQTQARAARPFFAVRNHGLYYNRNPAIFMLVSELFIRAGARSPQPILAFTLLLWNVGLWFCFAWQREMFQSELFAGVGLTFLLTTPFLLHNSTSLQADPYAFCFMQLAFYCFVRYLMRGRERKWLVLTCVCYFVVCQNYWMYYLVTFLILLSLQLKHGKLSLRLSAWLALAPVLAFATTFLQVVYALGGFHAAVFRLTDILWARTGDWRIQGSQWNPHRIYLTSKMLANYPRVVAWRIEGVFGYPVKMYALMLGATLLLAGRDAWARYRWLLLAIPAGLAWNLVMVQHTVIHGFSAMYGYPTWMLIVSGFFFEIHSAFRPPRARVAFAALAGPLCALAFQQTYVPYLRRYVRNITAGRVVDPAPAVPPRSEHNPPRHSLGSWLPAVHLPPRTRTSHPPHPVSRSDWLPPPPISWPARSTVTTRYCATLVWAMGYGAMGSAAVGISRHARHEGSQRVCGDDRPAAA